MTKEEILNLCKKYIIAPCVMAEKFASKTCRIIIKPALVGVDNRELTYIESKDNDGLHANFYNSDGQSVATVSSEYAIRDYVYVREPYFEDNGNIVFCADDPGRVVFGKKKMVSARYMKKELARSFFRIIDVRLCRLHDLTCKELHGMGFRSFDFAFREYDADLSEKQFEFSRSEFNPFVFIYEIESVGSLSVSPHQSPYGDSFSTVENPFVRYGT